MKERPILFSAPMVRAILEGRKTQTRRLLQPQPFQESCAGESMLGHKGLAGLFAAHVFGHCAAKLLRCPFGAVGDRLWVRESFMLEWPDMDRPEDEDEFRGWVKRHYAATDPKPELYHEDSDPELDKPLGWRPSIHMPRWASRITLEVTGVRVERLQDISEEDGRAEGIRELPLQEGQSGAWFGDPGGKHDRSARQAFERLWDSINAKRAPWDSNPWVWVIEFKRLEPQEMKLAAHR